MPQQRARARVYVRAGPRKMLPRGKKMQAAGAFRLTFASFFIFLNHFLVVTLRREPF